MNQHKQPPAIAPLPWMGPRPFWSVMIPAYNRKQYLEKTLRSVLSQDPGADEMQIEVVDDASLADDIEPLVRRIAGDRVRFVRNPRNIGVNSNFNNCVERSRGHWVHVLATDDLVLPGFYERLRIALHDRSDIGAAFCRHEFIDDNERLLFTSDLESPTAGVLPDFIGEIGASQKIQTPSIVVRRSVYEQLGGLRLDLPVAADWEMWIRIAAQYPIWYEPVTLASYRVHSKSMTATFKSSGETFVDLHRCIEISRGWLPPDRAETISRRAREWVIILELLQTAQDKAVLRLVNELIDVSGRGPVGRSWLPPDRAEAATQSARERLYLQALSTISQDDAVLGLVKALTNLSSPWPMHRSNVTNALLRAASIHYRQGRPFQALLFVGRAVMTRPIVAGRPLKRAISSLFHKFQAETVHA